MPPTITAATSPTPVGCGDQATRVTRSLLAYGIVAGPLYLSVALAQALTRDGFDFTRHAASLLSNGDLGWIQIANFLVTGAMVVAAAVGIGRTRRLGRWGPRLLGVFGVSLLGAGVFVADPTLGFPTGTPDGPGVISWHGIAHFAVGGVGFLALVAACLVVGRRFAARGERGLAWYSRLTGIAFLAGFAGIASGSGSNNPAVVVGFWVAVAVAFGWISVLSARLYRSA